MLGCNTLVKLWPPSPQCHEIQNPNSCMKRRLNLTRVKKTHPNNKSLQVLKILNLQFTETKIKTLKLPQKSEEHLQDPGTSQLHSAVWYMYTVSVTLNSLLQVHL